MATRNGYLNHCDGMCNDRSGFCNNCNRDFEKSYDNKDVSVIDVQTSGYVDQNSVRVCRVCVCTNCYNERLKLKDVTEQDVVDVMYHPQACTDVECTKHPRECKCLLASCTKCACATCGNLMGIIHRFSVCVHCAIKSLDKLARVQRLVKDLDLDSDSDSESYRFRTPSPIPDECAGRHGYQCTPPMTPQKRRSVRRVRFNHDDSDDSDDSSDNSDDDFYNLHPSKRLCV